MATVTGPECDLIDGHTGKAHITSDDLAIVNEALFGASSGVLPWGDNFKIADAGNGMFSIGTGVGLVRGRRFAVTSQKFVSPDGGTAGYNVNYVVVAEYAKAADGTETVDIATAKGQATTGTATDPQLTEDQLALWRIPYTGTQAGTPVQLFTGLQAGGGIVEMHAAPDGWSSGATSQEASYVKFGSGLAVVWAKWRDKVSSWTATGNVYYNNDGAKRGLDFPFAMTHAAHHTEVTMGDGLIWHVDIAGTDSKTKAFDFYVEAPRDYGAADFVVESVAVGWWK